MRTAHLLSTTRPLEISFLRACNIPYVMSYLHHMVLFAAWNASGLCVCMVAQLPAHWNKHLLSAQFLRGNQNRRQKVFNRGDLRLFRGLDIQNFDKNSPICIASKFNLGALEHCLGLRPGIPPWQRDWREHRLIEYFYYYLIPRNVKNRQSGLKTYLEFSCLILSTCLVFRRCSTE